VVSEDIHDVNQDMVDLEECISNHSLGYIPSLEEFFHLQEKEEEEAEDKLVLKVGLDIDCRFEEFEDGPLAFFDPREILWGSSARCRDVLEVVWEFEGQEAEGRDIGSFVISHPIRLEGYSIPSASHRSTREGRYTSRRRDIAQPVSLQSIHHPHPRIHLSTPLSWHLYPQFPIYLRIIPLDLLFLLFTTQPELSSYFR
jgi:hypothetical protein